MEFQFLPYEIQVEIFKFDILNNRLVNKKLKTLLSTLYDIKVCNTKISLNTLKNYGDISHVMAFLSTAIELLGKFSNIYINYQKYGMVTGLKYNNFEQRIVNFGYAEDLFTNLMSHWIPYIYLEQNIMHAPLNNLYLLPNTIDILTLYNIYTLRGGDKTFVKNHLLQIINNITSIGLDTAYAFLKTNLDVLKISNNTMPVVNAQIYHIYPYYYNDDISTIEINHGRFAFITMSHPSIPTIIDKMYEQIKDLLFRL